MFLRSKVQEMILKRRSRSMNGGSAQQQQRSPSTVPCDSGGDSGSGSGGSKSATAHDAMFASPRLSHSSSLPAGTVVFGKNAAVPADAAESAEAAFSMSPTSVLDAAASFGSGSSEVVSTAGGGKRRPWREGLHGLADALDCTDEQRERSVLAATSPSLLRSCSLDRRVEFGVKNKSSWLPLCDAAAASQAPAAAAAEPGGDTEVMEPSSEDYTCVICRGPNPRTVHIFGDRVVEGAAETSPRPISTNLPARDEGAAAFLSL